VTTQSLGAARGASLARRFWIYQQERFPLLGYGPLIGVFTFSAAAYSRLLRRAPGFIGWDLFAAGVWTALVFFFLLRVLDEHKDAALDQATRPELPVPRGLITLAELRAVAGGALLVALALNALLAPVLLWAVLAVAFWAALVTKEFFISEWLRRHPTSYLVSHMLVMPMIDGYTTGLDWLAGGGRPPTGLWLFLLVTFLNGTLIEIGRKLRAPEDERPGVVTYSQAWGTRRAAVVWLLVLVATAGTATLAASHAGASPATTALLIFGAVVAGMPALAFTRKPRPTAARQVEAASGIWTLALYLLLGAIPFTARWVG
jgi:4-hydroxybenzoate polyprenyltransferase